MGRPFIGLLTASAVSGIGDGVVAVAMPLLAATITRDPVAVAGVAIAQRAPWVLLSLHGGALVDRLSLRRLLPAIEVIRGLTLLLLAATIVTDAFGLPLLYVVAFIIGSGDTIVASGLHTAVPILVKDDLDRANGRIDMTQVAGDAFIGPALGGTLFALAASVPFAVDGVSFLIAALLLRRVLPERAPQPVSAAGPTSLTADVLEGLRWFRSNRTLRLLATVIAFFAFFQAAVLSLLVLLTTGRLGLGEAQFGLFLTCGAAGSLVGGLLVARLRITVSRVVVISGTGIAVCYLVMGLTTSAPVAGLAFAIEGLLLSVANISTVGLRQRLIPPHLLGRVGAAFRLCLFGAMPLGALTGGLVATATDVGMATWLAGAGQLVIVALLGPALSRALTLARSGTSVSEGR